MIAGCGPVTILFPMDGAPELPRNMSQSQLSNLLFITGVEPLQRTLRDIHVLCLFIGHSI